MQENGPARTMGVVGGRGGAAMTTVVPPAPLLLLLLLLLTTVAPEPPPLATATIASCWLCQRQEKSLSRYPKHVPAWEGNDCTQLIDLPLLLVAGFASSFAASSESRKRSVGGQINAKTRGKYQHLHVRRRGWGGSGDSWWVPRHAVRYRLWGISWRGLWVRVRGDTRLRRRRLGRRVASVSLWRVLRRPCRRHAILWRWICRDSVRVNVMSRWWCVRRLHICAKLIRTQPTSVQVSATSVKPISQPVNADNWVSRG